MADQESQGRTPKQERQAQRRLQRKLARAVEDVAYGLRYAQQGEAVPAEQSAESKEDVAYGAAAYGAAAYGAGKRESASEGTGVQAQVRQMLNDELGDLFKD